MASNRTAYIQLHISVLLWGFTAILGRLITLSELPLVWYRVLITCAALFFFPGIWKQVRATPRKELLKLAGIGVLVCTHWLCFYGSIKYSDVSISLCCLATTAFIISIIEPIINRTRFKWYEVSLGLLIIPGVIIIANVTKLYTTGIVLGILAAFFAALFTVLNKKVIHLHHPYGMTLVELTSGFIFLTLLMPAYIWLFPGVPLLPGTHDLVYLAILALGCTTVPFILALHALKQLSAFATTLTVNLEPVYGIAMAIPFFHEDKDLGGFFYVGTVIILLAVFAHPLLKIIFEPKSGELTEN